MIEIREKKEKTRENKVKRRENKGIVFKNPVAIKLLNRRIIIENVGKIKIEAAEAN
jgi:hypothetical protein